MTTDQADAAAKSVTDVLASIDDVLEDVEAQASPAGPAAPTPNVAAEEQSGSGTEEAAEASQAAVTLAKGPLAPATPTAATHGPGAPSRAAQPGNDTAPPAWWDKVYRDQDADLDTHTGNVPGPLSPDEGLDAPPMPDHAPQVPSTEAQKPGDGPGDIPAELPSARRRLRLHKLRRRENADGDQEGELEPPRSLRRAAHDDREAGAYVLLERERWHTEHRTYWNALSWWAGRTSWQRFVLRNAAAAAAGAWTYGAFTAGWDKGLPQLVLGWMDNMATEFREPVGPIMLGLIATGAFTAVGNRIYRFIVRIFSEDGSFAATPAGRIIRWLLVSIPFSSGFAAVCLFAAP